MVGWVGVGSVRVVGWRVVNELRNEELLMGGVLSEAVQLLCEVFCELIVSARLAEGDHFGTV